MAVEVVCDASVAVKCLFDEEGSPAALELVRRRPLIAPDFILLELASVAAKKVKRSEVPADFAALSLSRAADLFDSLTPAIALRERAFELGLLPGVSLYDALYLALAERTGLSVVTADMRFVRSAAAAGFSNSIEALA